MNYLLNRRPELSNVLVERSIKPFVRESFQDKIPLTGADEDEIFKGINNYFRGLAARQIKISILCHTY